MAGWMLPPSSSPPMVRKEYMQYMPVQQAGNGLYYRVKIDDQGKVGVDYFGNDQTGTTTIPISREQFESSGGDPQYIENQVAGTISEDMSFRREAQRAAEIGVPYDSERITPDQAGQYIATGQNKPTTGAGGTGVASVPQFQTILGGRTYTDPQAYADAQRALVEEYYNQNMTSLGRDYSELERQLAESEGDVIRQYGEGTSALGQALERGKFRTAQQFDVMAPSLYQSGEGITLQEKQKTYDEQLAENSREKERALQEIMRGRQDIQYNRPLEEAQYARSKQQQFDEIANQLLQNRQYMQGTGTGYQTKDENALKSALGAYKAPSLADYNIGYGIDTTPAVESLSAVGNQPVGTNFAQQGKTTEKKKKLPSPLDYLYAY